MGNKERGWLYVSDNVCYQPYERSFENQSPALAFLAVVLGTMGLTDLVSLSLPEEICLIHHWGTQGNLPCLFPFPPKTTLLYTPKLTLSPFPIYSSRPLHPRPLRNPLHLLLLALLALLPRRLDRAQGLHVAPVRRVGTRLRARGLGRRRPEEQGVFRVCVCRNGQLAVGVGDAARGAE